MSQNIWSQRFSDTESKQNTENFGERGYEGSGWNAQRTGLFENSPEKLSYWVACLKNADI